MTEGGLVRGCHCKAQKILKKPSQRRGQYCLHIFNFYHKLLQSWLPLEIRSILLQSFDDGDISEYEFLLLYNLNTSKNPDFLYESYGKFDLNDMDDCECLSEFCFRKSDLPVLSEALHLPNYCTGQQGAICDGIERLCITL